MRFSDGNWFVENLDASDFTTCDDLDPIFDLIDRKAGRDRQVIGIRGQVNAEAGKGTWDFLRIANGFYLLIGDVNYNEDKRWAGADGRMIKVRILLSGRINSSFHDLNITGPGAFVEAMPGNESSTFEFGAKRQTRVVTLSISKAYLEQCSGPHLKDAASIVTGFFEPDRSKPIGGVLKLGPSALRAANDLMREKAMLLPGLRKQYYDAKAHEILTFILQDLLREGQQPTVEMKYSLRDLDRLHEAREMLQSSYRSPPTIAELARKVAVNETKLKRLFKAMFHTTIFQYVQDLRMQEAFDLLTEGGQSCSEVAHQLGYDHPSNFTAAFRRHHNVSPSDLRKRMRRRTTSTNELQQVSSHKAPPITTNLSANSSGCRN